MIEDTLVSINYLVTRPSAVLSNELLVAQNEPEQVGPGGYPCAYPCRTREGKTTCNTRYR